MASGMDNMPAKHAACIVCQTPDACTYCFHCAAGMCASCKERHDTRYESHSQLSLNNTPSPSRFFCKQHERHVEAFCNSCSRAVCAICRLTDHYDHQVYDLTFCKEQPDIEVISAIDVKEASEENLLTELQTLKTDFNTKMDRAKQDLKDQRNKVLGRVNEHYENLYSKLQQRQDKVNTELKISIGLVQETLTELQRRRQEVISKIQPLKPEAHFWITEYETLLIDFKEKIPSSGVAVPRPKALRFVANEGTLGSLEEEADERRETKVYAQQPPRGVAAFGRTQYQIKW